MLTHLSIRNFTIAEHLEVEFSRGMTAITGETGAGKSISLDALGLALGDRADSATVRRGCERAEISATFDISAIPNARQWLQERDLDQDDICILRRTIGKDGRSRAFINGQPTPLGDLKALGGLLIDIHSQHAHQSLLKKETHRLILDHYGDHIQQTERVRSLAQEWQRCHLRLESLLANSAEQQAKSQLLTYQVKELEELALGEDELTRLEEDHKTLAHAEQILLNTHKALQMCEGEDGALLDTLQHICHTIADVSMHNKTLGEAYELLQSAQIQIEEARRNLQHHADSFEADPERLTYVESRLNDIYDTARKHHVAPEMLIDLTQKLRDELNESDVSDELLETLAAERQALLASYQQEASKLSKSRKKAAHLLAKQVTQQLQQLGMLNCQFDIALTERNSPEPHALGLEDIEFVVATNPGQAPGALHKIASGGELSRISLAIQVIAAKTSVIPTLVFDEVDVGIGGATAEIVGMLLRQLGEQGQVICVTHQPQVAARGHHHFEVRKLSANKSTMTQVKVLSNAEKIHEIARMLGGIAITDRTLAHAQEMLETAAA